MYTPTERTNITWAARNKTWRHISTESRDRAADFPLKFRALTLTDLPDSLEGRLVKAWAKRWGAYPTSGLSLEAKEGRGLGLWLHGPPGRGKTRMASIAGQHVSSLGWSTKFISAANLYGLNIQAMKEPEEDKPLTGAAGACEHWDGWRCLVLDDLGKEHHTASGYAENILDRLFRNRYVSGAPTIVTTNLSVKDIAKTYNESMFSYIHEAFEFIDLGQEKDHRRG